MRSFYDQLIENDIVVASALIENDVVAPVTDLYYVTAKQ